MRPRNNIDWAELAPRVALALLGEPDRKSGPEWRWKGQGGLTLNVRGKYSGRFHVWSEGNESLGVLDIIRRETGGDPMEWLADRGFIEPREQGRQGRGRVVVCDRSRSKQNAPNVPRKQEGNHRDSSDEAKRLRWARTSWKASRPIPSDSSHPARRWLARRRLWHPGLPLPAPVRWIPASAAHTGAGSIVALAAPPEAWASAWPELPEPVAVHLVSMDAEGLPALDRSAKDGGLGKRTLGLNDGSLVTLGNPRLDEAAAPVHVVEGLADALAMASRHEGLAVSALGTSAMRNTGVAQWLAGAPQGVEIHCDSDEPKQGRPPAGRRAAAVLMTGVTAAGGRAVIIPPPAGSKDVAEACGKEGDFEPLPEEWAGYARTLQDMTNWPRWEIARVAAIAMWR